jgi:hypothetical protein
MVSTHKRAMKALLVAPLFGAFVCALLMLVALPNKPSRSSNDAVGLVFVLYFPLITIFMYGMSWLVGIPAYLLLYGLGQLRQRWFVLLYALAGAAVGVYFDVQSHHPGSTGPAFGTLTVIGVVTGAALGGAVGRMTLGASPAVREPAV